MTDPYFRVVADSESGSGCTPYQTFQELLFDASSYYFGMDAEDILSVNDSFILVSRECVDV